MTDPRSPASADDATDAAADPLHDFQPVALAHRHDGWTAKRQREFLTVLAETGSIGAACDAVGMTPRSAYRLRAHPRGRAFAIAWEQALMMAAPRLMTIAYERAINGVPRSVWKDDVLISETRVPSDRLLMYLLTHLMPRTFGGMAVSARRSDLRQYHARHELPVSLDALEDIAQADCPAELLGGSDYAPTPPLPERA